jgi:hypothetical protein
MFRGFVGLGVPIAGQGYVQGMSEEPLHEKWVPDVADREGGETPDQEWASDQSAAGETPDQEWLPEHAAVDGFERQGDGHYACQWCAARVPGTRAAIDQHRATHA